jgi:hypothetical protein
MFIGEPIAKLEVLQTLGISNLRLEIHETATFILSAVAKVLLAFSKTVAVFAFNLLNATWY